MAFFKRTGSSFTTRNTVRLINSGAEYFDLLKDLIQKANQVIHLQTYIFNEDETGNAVAQVLKEASKRGVQVYLVVDGYASQNLSGSFIKELTDAGVHFRWFHPLLKSRYFYLGRRLHHKIVTVDGQHGVIGGINISNLYNNTANNLPWLDFALYIEGEALTEIKSICERRAVQSTLGLKKINVKHSQVVSNFKGNCMVGVRVNDWVLRKKEITDCYAKMLRKASSDVIIMSPYFIPDHKFMRSLNAVARRGVRIRLILAGVSDVLLSKYAERYVYHSLFKKNIEIYEYQKNVLHGKMAVCDKEWVTVGSYNINRISTYASIELNVEVKDMPLATEVRKIMESIISADCELITKEGYSSTNFFKRLLYFCSYTIFRVMFFLFTFYYRQREQ